MEKRITDDLDALLDILPPHIRRTLAELEDRHDLLEVVHGEELALDVPHAVIGEVTEEKTLDFGPRLRVPLSDAHESFFHWKSLR